MNSSDKGADLYEFQDRLLTWGEYHRRDFPWRNTRDPYAVFVAEVLLHRTRADQVVPLYHAALNAYSGVSAMASADREELHRLLHASGLRWRVESMLEAAKQIELRFGGIVPSDRGDLETLPGVGHYIATAIRCFAYGKPDAIVDTNTVRVVARMYDREITDGLRRSKQFRILIEGLLDPERPREFNYALLDLAALVCTPKKPRCNECPIVEFCEYGRANIGGHAAA